MTQQSTRVEDERRPVAGLGKRSYALRFQPDSASSYGSVTVVALAGSYVAAVKIGGYEGLSLNTTEARAIELMKMVVSKLQ